MKKLILIILILTSCTSNSPENKVVTFSELAYTYSKDSTSMTVLVNDKPLDGNYKIVDETFPTRYSITHFVDDRAEGISKNYLDDILTSTIDMKNGVANGLSVVYDKSGANTMWKIEMVNGKEHGKAWFKDVGDVYYIMGAKLTKSEYEDYERNLKNN